MGQLLHGSARTTAALRRAIQQSQESIAKLAKRDDLNPTTVAKWKKRMHVKDAPMGPKPPRSTVLSQEEAMKGLTSYEFIGQRRFYQHAKIPRIDSGRCGKSAAGGMLNLSADPQHL
jgi:hypothetical protein